jgi:hypothetical protein
MTVYYVCDHCAHVAPWPADVDDAPRRCENCGESGQWMHGPCRDLDDAEERSQLVLDAHAHREKIALDSWIAEAHKLGAEDAKAAASWITDGNDTDESRRAKLQRIEDDGPDSVIGRRPDLSGEYADNPTPLSLAREITGDDDPDADTVDALADAYELGVSDEFEDACVAELERWLS